MMAFLKLRKGLAGLAAVALVGGAVFWWRYKVASTGDLLSATGGSKTYTVKSGDTLDGIAQRFKIAGGFRALATLNNISNPDVILPGMVLKLG